MAAANPEELSERLRAFARNLHVYLEGRRYARPRGGPGTEDEEVAWARETLRGYTKEFCATALALFDEAHKPGQGDQKLRAFVAQPIPARARSAQREITAANTLPQIVTAFEKFAAALPDSGHERRRIRRRPTARAALQGVWKWLRRLDPWIQSIAALLAIGGFIVSLVLSCRGGDPRTVAGAERTLTVDNRLTDGATLMREDTEAAYLSTVPRANCSLYECDIAGTKRHSGGTFAPAVCQAKGERTTNGQDDNSLDDQNPGLFSSRRYYGVRMSDDRLGYVSEVWISARQRGGLGLPACP